MILHSVFPEPLSILNALSHPIARIVTLGRARSYVGAVNSASDISPYPLPLSFFFELRDDTDRDISPAPSVSSRVGSKLPLPLYADMRHSDAP